MSLVLDMVGLTVKNMAKSLAFYRTLGIDVPDPDDGGPYTEFKQANGLRLSWNDVEMIKSIDPEYVEPVGQRIAIAFLCDGPRGVDEVYDRVIAAGYAARKEPWDAFWGQRYAIVEDPDGNSVDLFAPLSSN